MIKVNGNARIFKKEFEDNKGGKRIAFSVAIVSKVKDSEEFARIYIPAVLGKELKEKISDKTPDKFDVYINDASLFVNSYNGKNELRMFIAGWEAPKDEPKPAAKPAKKPEPKEEELPY